MINSRHLAVIAGLLLALGGGVADAQDASSPLLVDWAKTLGRYDMEWDRLPQKWNEAPFLGNGEQGTLMVQLDDRTLRFDVGCSAAHDHRPFSADDLREKHVEVLNRGRLPIGSLRLETPADLLGGTGRLSLWDAEATGSLKSADGAIRWTSLVHATEPVIFLEFTSSGDLSGSKVRFVPDPPLNPRAVRAKEPRQPAHSPSKSKTFDDGVQACVQDLVAGGQTAVAWAVKRSRGRTRVWLSVQHSFPSALAVDRAVAAVRKAQAADQAEWLDEHRGWWHDYYPASFVATGDGFWDAFYWIQQYKLACVTRDRGWIIDNQGPWLQPTAWNGTWWNLNAQLSHLGGVQANRRGMVSALRYRLGLNRESLTMNVAEPYRHDSAALGRSVSGWDLLGHAGEPGGRKPLDKNIGRECGNLLWALHNVDLEYRHWVDLEVRDTVLIPLLIRSVNYYRHFLEKHEDGLWHLPTTYSPEYGSAPDCTYDLDLLRWAVGRLVELSAERRWTEKTQPLLAVWKELQQNLVPVAVNETGRMIGRGVALKGGHRHWSHLLAVYPLRTLTPELGRDYELIEQSLMHWRSFDRGIAGYAHTASSCMASILGEGDQALLYLEQLVPYLHSNTLYSEIGLPVMETPLHGATAIQEMLFQSWGGCLRVFPSVPSAWPDAQFARFRGEGGFLVSSSRNDGSTQWVEVESTIGGTTEIITGIDDPAWSFDGEVAVTELSKVRLRLKAAPGSTFRVWSKAAAPPEFSVRGVPLRTKPHRFGLPAVPREPR